MDDPSDLRKFLWPIRKEVPKDLERLVTPAPTDANKFVTFGLTQEQLKGTLQPGCRLPFSGQAEGAVTVETIEDPEGRDIVADRAFRFTGRTDKGMPVIVHIWFSPKERETESGRSRIFFDPSQKPAEAEKPKIETKIRFADGWEKVRDDTTTFSAGGAMDLRLQSTTDWTPRTVSILSRTDDVSNGTVVFKVMGDHKLATVVLNLRQPADSKIIFDQ